MREIVNISLPKELSREIDKLLEKGHYSTKSEFLRELIRERIAEDDLLARIEEGRAEYRAGKAKKLRSLADLD